MTGIVKQHQYVTTLLRWFGVAAASTQLVACVHAPRTDAAPAVVPELASFSVAETTGSGSDCEFTLHLEGMARPRDGQLELVIPRSSIAATRVNNKRMDFLQMQIGAGGRPSPNGRLVVLRDKTPTVVLSPTVDSAGPQLTTWQADDTLRLLMPWRPASTPRWLYFSLSYTTVAYDGEVKTCGGAFHSDSLRFVASPAASMMKR